MNFTGLSLDQAPPISAPLRFFLTAPLFGFIAATLLLFADQSTIMSRFSSETIGFVHLITIGVFAMVMLGALQQMLPVLAGVTLPWALNIARISHLLLSFGLLAMVAGLFTTNTSLMLIAMLLLGGGFLLILFAITRALVKVENFNATVRSMSASVALAFGVVGLGEYLLSAHMQANITQIQLSLSDVHAVLGIFGFAGLLIIGVTFQVLPMFYVAPRFKRFCKKYVLWLILTGLLLWSLTTLFFPIATLVGKLVIVLFFFAFTTTVLKKLKERRRPIADVTIWYWKTGAISFMMGSVLWLLQDFVHQDLIAMISIFIGGGFILSIITGMLYKIVPFLSWFHLNASGYMQIPTMREFINVKVAKAQYFAYVTALFLGILSYWFEAALMSSAIALGLSFLLLEYNLLSVVLRYREIKKREPDFVMPNLEMSHA